jgi:hypothetical protein
MTEVTFHQPRFRVMWIYLQNTVKKNLCYFPPFFRYGTCCVGPIDSDLRILVVAFWAGFSSKNRKCFHLFGPRMAQMK